MLEEFRLHLIHGNRKSGTTMLAALIDNENNFVLPTETPLHEFHTLKRLIDENCFKKSNIEFFFGYPQLDNFDQVSYEKSILKDLKLIEKVPDWVFYQYKNLLDFSNHPNKMVKNIFIKSVGHYPDHVYNQFLEFFPDGKIISLSRNLTYNFKAIIIDRKNNNRKKIMTTNWYQKLRYYLVYLDELYVYSEQQIKYTDHPSIIKLDYDDLRVNHENIVSKVMNFCELDFLESNKYTTKFGKKSKVRTHSLKTKPGELKFSTKKLYTGLSFFEYILVVANPGFNLLWRVYKFVRRT